jgi:hypothetical protein
MAPTTFDALPLELRRKIWGYLLPEPRSIITTGYETGIYNEKTLKITIPVALHTNSESRRETLRHYQLLFDGKYLEGKSQYTYFNPSIDTVRLRKVDFLQFFDEFREMPTGLSAIKNLELETGEMPFGWAYVITSANLNLFTSLKKLTYVVSCEGYIPDELEAQALLGELEQDVRNAIALQPLERPITEVIVKVQALNFEYGFGQPEFEVTMASKVLEL